MSANKKILVVLTSVDKMASGKETGWYLPELAHPYAIFKKYPSISLTFASPLGGVAPLDPGSVTAFAADPIATAFAKEQTALWSNTAKLSDFLATGAADFDAVFFPGGHGPMFDLAAGEALGNQGGRDTAELIARFVAAGKVVAAVCHGSAVLGDVKAADGTYAVKGKKVAGFTNEEETQAGAVQDMPYLLEDKLRERGALFEKAEAWGVKVAVDGIGDKGSKLVTGQNPASANDVGLEIVKALGL